jgi:hypothetical protein
LKSHSYSIWSISSKIIGGIIHGCITWLIYTYILPKIFTAFDFHGLAGARLTSTAWLGLLAFFIALGVAESIMRKHPISLILTAFTGFIGFSILLYILNYGQIRTEIEYEGYIIGITIDLRLILTAAFLLITLPVILLTAYEYFKKRTEEM